MDREQLNKMLKMYASRSYWHGEKTGNYGEPDPEIHQEVESVIWAAISQPANSADAEGRCPKCNKPVSFEQRYCWQCGYRLRR